jgi:TM2 domain-containing membrane protein YozV
MAQYRVVGKDGQVYGPADTDQLKVWIGEGRLSGDTNLIDVLTGLVQRADANPDLYQTFAATAPPVAPPSPVQRTADPGAAPVQHVFVHQVAPVYPAGSPPRTKLVAILLALFLGPLGVHRFYMGLNGTAVAMLLITVLTCGYGSVITWIWAIIDIIMIATGSLSDAQGQLLQ